MESTVLVEIDSESRLTFATNSSGVVLISQFGNIGFSADEFQYYQCLFKLTDTENIGKLRVGSISLSSILHRTDLKYDVMKKLLIIAINSISRKPVRIRKASSSTSLPLAENKDPDIDDIFSANLAIDDYHKIDKWNPDADTADLDFPSLFISLHQWLLLCKLILYIQINPGVTPDDSLVETICSIYDSENQTTGGKRTDSSISTSSPATSIFGRNHINGILGHEKKPIVDTNHVVTATATNNEDSNMKSTISTTGHFANFRLGVAVASPHSSLKGARVTGWEVCSEGFHKPHTKFNICLTQSSTNIIDVERKEMEKDIATLSHLSNLSSGDARVVDSGPQEGSGSTGVICAEGQPADLPASISHSESQPQSPSVTVTAAPDLDLDLDQGSSDASPAPHIDSALPMSSPSPPPAVADAGSKKNKKALKKKKKASEIGTGRGSGLDSHSQHEYTGPPSMPPPLLDLAASRSNCSASVSSKPSPPSTSSLPQCGTSASASLTPEQSAVVGPAEITGSGVGSVASNKLTSDYAASNGTWATSPSPGTDIDTDTDTGGNTVAGTVRDDQRMLAESDARTRVEDQESQRRYSDFEVLVCVLQRLYKGVILPPLPPKTWLTQLQQQTLPSQLFAVQRQAELQLFLSAMLAHPVMRHSFELVMFLRTSRVGLNSFRLTFPLFTFDSNGGVIFNYRNKNLVKSGSEFISGIYYMSLSVSLSLSLALSLSLSLALSLSLSPSLSLLLCLSLPLYLSPPLCLSLSVSLPLSLCFSLSSSLSFSLSPPPLSFSLSLSLSFSLSPSSLSLTLCTVCDNFLTLSGHLL
jgi:PX domain